MFDVNIIEIGDRVKFNTEECKKRSYLGFNRELCVPRCLVGLTVDGEAISKGTDFLVLEILQGEWGVLRGIILQTDRSPMYFDYSLFEFSSM